MRRQEDESKPIKVTVDEAPVDPDVRRAARSAWARLIQKVYEAGTMLCPHCGEEMRLVANRKRIN